MSQSSVSWLFQPTMCTSRSFLISLIHGCSNQPCLVLHTFHGCSNQPCLLFVLLIPVYMRVLMMIFPCVLMFLQRSVLHSVHVGSCGSMTEQWFVSLNHKRIGVMYLVFGVFSAVVAFHLSVVIRVELGCSCLQFLHDETLQFYNVVITGHGLLMIFFFIMPFIIGGTGNTFTPVLVGACDMSFPRLTILVFELFPLLLHLL